MVRVHGPEQRKLRPWLIVGTLLALAVATSTLAIHGGAARSRLPTAIRVGPNATAGDGCRYESQLQGLLDVSTQTLQLVQAASGSLRQAGSAGLDADRLPAGASGQQRADVLQRELEAARRRSQELEWQLEESRAKGGSGGGGTVRLGAPTVRGTIPRKLHHMYLGDDGPPDAHKAWMESCKAVMNERGGWEYKLWGTEDVEELIRKHRPDFLKTFRGYRKHVMRIDAGKYLILQYVGGLYVDTDTECFRDGYDMLEGYDLVVQQDYGGPAANSGVLAVKPNHPIWDAAWSIIEERAKEKDHDPNDTGYLTGPQIIRDMIIKWHETKLDSGGHLLGLLQKAGTTTRIYPLGTWLTPCGFSSGGCHEDFMLSRVAGTVNLTQLVGYHRFTALWLGYRDGLRPQTKDSIRSMFCKGVDGDKEGKGLPATCKDLQKERNDLKGEVGSRWNDAVTAATADQQQLAKWLKSQDGVAWLKSRAAAVEALPKRGIVVAASGKELLANAFVMLRVLQAHLGCKLPVSIMYWGEEERIGPSTVKFFQQHLTGVEFIDSSQRGLPLHQRPLTPRRLDGRFYGWKPKIAAVYTAPYQEVLYLDADSQPLLDPTALFDWPDYKQKGNLFFPEHHRREVELFRYFGLHNPWAAGADKSDMPLQAESGQLLLNRRQHLDVLEWLWFINVHDEVTYRVAHGDKDTFRAAFDLAGKRAQYYQSPHPSADGLKDTGASSDLRYFKHAILQLAPNGSLAFAHRVWFNKYDPDKDEGRAFDYMTIENSSGRADVMRHRWGLEEGQASIQRSCTLNPYDLLGTQERCGLDPGKDSLPVPVLRVPEGSYLAKVLAASDTAFKELRSALKSDRTLLA